MNSHERGSQNRARPGTNHDSAAGPQGRQQNPSMKEEKVQPWKKLMAEPECRSYTGNDPELRLQKEKDMHTRLGG